MLKIGVFPEDIIDSHIAPTSGKARHDRDDAIEKRAHRSQKCTSRAFRASNAPLPVRDPIKNESFLFPERGGDFRPTRRAPRRARTKSRSEFCPKCTYRFHRARSSLLKRHSVGRFAQVNGVFSRDNVVGTHFYAWSRSVKTRCEGDFFVRTYNGLFPFTFYNDDDVFDNTGKSSLDLFFFFVEVVYVVVATAKI